MRLLSLGLLALTLGACSPEADRTRGDGPGGDTGNRTAQVQLHAGNETSYGTPNLNPRLASPAQK